MVKIRLKTEIQQRKPNRRNAFYTSLHSGGHRSRVNNIDGGICSMIYPRNHQIWPARKNLIQSQFYAVHRRSATCEIPLSTFHFYLLHHQGRIYRDGVSLATLRRIWRHYNHLSYLVHKFYEFSNSWCGDSIIIRYQNQWFFILLIHYL